MPLLTKYRRTEYTGIKMKSILIHDKGSNILYEATVYQVVTLFTEATRCFINNLTTAKPLPQNKPYQSLAVRLREGYWATNNCLMC